MAIIPAMRLAVGLASAVGLAVTAWWIIDEIGDKRELENQNRQLISAMEIDNREDKKLNKVLLDSQNENIQLKAATNVLARLVPKNIEVDICWSTPLPPDFVRVYKSNYGKGIQASAPRTDESNTVSNPVVGVSYGQALLLYDLALKSCNADKKSLDSLADKEEK